MNMNKANIEHIKSTIPDGVTIVCASKYGISNDIRFLFDCGITNFGENRVDAFLTKYSELKDLPISWHFIGHLQRNKCKQLINQIDYLHSLDSLELAKLINKERKAPLKCFIEVSINEEENKNGVFVEDLPNFIASLLELPNIDIIGFMMMTISECSPTEKRNQFHQLKLVKEDMENRFNRSFPYLSMGMSDDYLEAIKENATHVRLGRILFKD